MYTFCWWIDNKSVTDNANENENENDDGNSSDHGNIDSSQDSNNNSNIANGHARPSQRMRRLGKHIKKNINIDACHVYVCVCL